MAFDVSLVSRVSEEIGHSARRLKEHVNSPNELIVELQKIESSINSLKNLTEGIDAAGMNATTTQHAPNQNQT